MAQNITILILAGLLVWREWENRRERRELMDRIMCVDFKEFKALTRETRVTKRGRMSDAEMAAVEIERMNNA